MARLDTIRLTTAFFIAVFLAAGGCGNTADVPLSAGIGPDPVLPPPEPSLIPTVNIAPASPWLEGEMPEAAPGTRVQAFARDLVHPRWLYVLPNGDVLVAETNAPPRPEAQGGIKGWFMKKMMKRAGAGVPSADRITLLRDANGDGEAETRTAFLTDLYSPFGMALVGNDLYVANTDAVLRFPYTPGQTRIDAAGEKVMDLPAGPINYHWTKNIIASPDGRRLYATVGSNSNIGENGMENEEGRAAIWVLDLDSREKRLYATGLRNPNGLAFVPPGGELWTAVNERDEIGSDLVPDYITSVEDGGFYGWPYSYYGAHVDERVKPPRPDLVEQAIAPDYATGPHTSTIGLAWSAGRTLAPVFGRGLFIGQHGSWNRKPLSGYKVIYVPFNEGGEPSGKPVDVLTGFLDADSGEANGRPVGVVIGRRGELYVADDVGNTVWRVSAAARD